MLVLAIVVRRCLCRPSVSLLIFILSAIAKDLNGIDDRTLRESKFGAAIKDEEDVSEDKDVDVPVADADAIAITIDVV